MVSASRIREAEELLEQVKSWTESEIEELPKLYQQKAREYQGLLQPGEE
jgi:Tfp pilus assembly protein PilP